MSATALMPLNMEGVDIVERQLGALQSDVKHLDERMQRYEENTSRRFALLEGTLNERLSSMERSMDTTNELMAEIRGGTKALRWVGTALIAVLTFVATTAWWAIDKWSLWRFPMPKP